MSSESKAAVYAATTANIGIAVSKFLAAAITGSSAMIAEGIHSVVDTCNELLLLLGIHTSKKPPDEQHPFGHGHELYFWTLIVAVVIFAGGGGMSVYEGISHLLHPGRLEDPLWNYIVLGVAFLFESGSLAFVLKKFYPGKDPDDSLFSAIRKSKDPSLFTVIYEDMAALGGITLAFLGVLLGHALNNEYLDGCASIAIGLLLSLVAILLSIESKGLLVGESAGPVVEGRIYSIVNSFPEVEKVLRMITLQLGPEEVLLNIDIKFRKGLDKDLSRIIDDIEKAIQEQIPQIRYMFLETQSLKPGRGNPV